jgi:plastocyanin
MKGARALAIGMLVLAMSCAIPAISAAQDAGTTTDATTTTTTTTGPTTPPVEPGDGSDVQTGSQDTNKPAGNDKGGVAETPTPAPSAQPQPAATASSPVSGKARASASASVTMGDLFFSPVSVTVAVGDTVTWRNTGQAPHNATADDGSFKTPDLNNGQSASHTFTQAGSFSYICTIHPNMKGTVRVLSSGGGGGGGGGGGNASSSGSSGSATSEASAVGSPGAAGDANTLPMTGMAVGGLALVGLALLALGLIARQADREGSRRRWLPIF